MPSYFVETPHCRYPVLVERGGLAKVRDYIPPRVGKVFLISTEDVWKLHGASLARSLGDPEVLFFPGGEPRKRLVEVEILAEKRRLHCQAGFISRTAHNTCYLGTKREILEHRGHLAFPVLTPSMPSC